MTSTKATYCPICGSSVVTKRIEDRQRKFCPQCENVLYRNPKPCAGVLVVDDDSILLVKRTVPPAVGHWSLPAGYLEYDEPPRQAAVRELEEETGVRTDREAIELVDTQFVSHEEGSNVLVLLYAVSRSDTDGTPAPGSDAGDARFWTHNELTPDAPIEPGYRDIFRRVIREYGDSNMEAR